MKDQKQRRSYAPGRARARRYTKAWYRQQVDEGRARYRSGGVLVSSSERESAIRTQAQRRLAPGSDPALWRAPDTENGEPTARGVETRVGKVRELPATRPSDRVGSNPFARGGYRENADVVDAQRARDIMVRVFECGIEFHHALEADAAGFTFEQMAGVWNVSAEKAREWTYCGLAAVDMYLRLT
jgi:hypothetical protein